MLYIMINYYRIKRKQIATNSIDIQVHSVNLCAFISCLVLGEIDLRRMRG